MSSTILRPNTTLADTSTLTGGATADDVLSDSSDATYLQLAEEIGTNDATRVGFDGFTLPAGDAIRDATLTLRSRRLGTLGSGIFVVGQDFPGTEFDEETTTVVTWTVVTTHAPLGPVVGLTETDLDGAVLDMTVGDGSATVRVNEAFITVIHVEQPVIDDVTVGGGAAPIEEDSTPTVEWETTLDPDGGIQLAWNVKIFSDAVHDAVGFDPETSSTIENVGAFDDATSWAPTDALPDGVYHAYVRVAQLVAGAGHLSDWAGQEFEIDTPAPAQPSLTVLPDPDNARIELLVVEGSGGAADTDLFELQRTEPDGTWVSLRGPLSGGRVDNDDGSISLYDYEAGNGDEVTYRVRAIHEFAGGTESRSEWTEAIGQWEVAGAAYLKHATAPALNMPVTIYRFPGRNRAARQGWHEIPGRSAPVGVLDVRSGNTGEIAFMVEEEDAAAFEELTEQPAPLLLQFSPDAKAVDRWLVLGDLAIERYIDRGWIEEGIWGFGWTEVERPSVDTVTLPDLEPPAELPDELDYDAFSSPTPGTGELSWTHTPGVDDPRGVVVAIVQDNVGTATDSVSGVTVGGVPLDRVLFEPHPNANIGSVYFYFLGAGIPEGPQTVVVSVSGAQAKAAGCWSVSGSGDTSIAAQASSPFSGTVDPSVDLVTTEDSVMFSALLSGLNDIAGNAPGANFTGDLEHDFGVDTAAFAHSLTTRAAGTTAAGYTATIEAFALGAVAVGLGVAVPPGGDAAVMKQDLVEADDPCPLAGIDRGWRKVESAYSSGPDLNWTSGDLQIARLSASPDPHIAVGEVSPSTHYRRLTVSEVYLAGSLSGTPTSIAVTADADFPVPSAGICSIDGERSFRYTGRTGSFPNYTLTGVTWINTTPSSFPAATRVPIQSQFDSGVPNDSYRTQLIRGSTNPASSFYVFEPGTRRQIVFSTRFQDPSPLIGTSADTGRDQIFQMKPSPSTGIGPIFAMLEYEDSFRMLRDVTGTAAPITDFIELDKSVGWMRFLLDITFDANPSIGRFQLFGDLDGDRLEIDDLVPLTEQLSLKTCFTEAEAPGVTSNMSIGPYCRMTVPAHWRDYANVQVIDPT